MAGLPADVSTGIIRVGLRTVSLLADVPDVESVTGSVVFTPSPEYLKLHNSGIIIPTEPISAYLDANGDADITLIATDDPDVNPQDWTYEVSFDLDGVSIAPFHIDVPSGSDRELVNISPVPDSNGTYYVVQELGYYPVISETAPAQTTINSLPVVWYKPSGTLASVPAVPQQPAWDIANRTVTVASTVGVQYYLDGAPITAGVANPITGAGSVTVTVTTSALPGYVLPGTYTWVKQFVDYTASSIYATTTFTGSNGTLLVPNSGSGVLTGIAWDMGSGGDAGTAPNWQIYNPGAGMYQIQSNQLYFKRVTGSGSNDTAVVNAGATNMYLEFDVLQFPKVHGEALSIRPSCRLESLHPSGWSPGNSVRMTYDAGGGWRVYGPDNTYYTLAPYNDPVDETNNIFIGTWRVTSWAQVLTIDAPDGSSFSWDFSATSPSLFGTYMLINSYSNTPDTTPQQLMDNFVLGRWV